MSGRWLIGFLGLLPRNVISRAAGRFVSLRLPGWLQRLEIRAAVRVFGIDLAEARDPVESFDCFQSFFTRALVDGARRIDPAADAIVSPCDGAWGASGLVEDGLLLQLKGQPYSLAALFGSDVDAKAYEGGSYATLYLSPADYHRFHSPCAAAVSRVRYLPGSLWPVNQAGLEGIDGLFAQNERIAAFMNIGGDPTVEGLCVVAVGATMVGKVRLSFDDLTTNEPGAIRAEREYGDAPHPPRPSLAKGEEWGRFEFGSTLVVLVAAGAGRLEPAPVGTTLRLGQRIGTRSEPAA